VCEVVRIQAKVFRTCAIESERGKEVLPALGIEYIQNIQIIALCVTWFPPLYGMLKINVDGASKGNPSRAGGGVV
ncbi:unnamed protein product, partial [Ilex paraguariensis]